jgi:hypothetical protein
MANHLKPLIVGVERYENGHHTHLLPAADSVPAGRVP